MSMSSPSSTLSLTSLSPPSLTPPSPIPLPHPPSTSTLSSTPSHSAPRLPKAPVFLSRPGPHARALSDLHHTPHFRNPSPPPWPSQPPSPRPPTTRPPSLRAQTDLIPAYHPDKTWTPPTSEARDWAPTKFLDPVDVETSPGLFEAVPGARWTSLRSLNLRPPREKGPPCIRGSVLDVRPPSLKERLGVTRRTRWRRGESGALGQKGEAWDSRCLEPRDEYVGFLGRVGGKVEGRRRRWKTLLRRP